MAEKLSACVKCRAPLKRPKTGRPPVYCGAPCRTAAAYEVKRLQRRLEALETRLAVQRHEQDDLSYLYASGRRRVEKRRAEAIEALTAEIGEAEERLRLLLDGPRGKPLSEVSANG